MDNECEPDGIFILKGITHEQFESLLSQWKPQGNTILLQAYNWETPVSWAPCTGNADPILTVFHEPKDTEHPDR